MWMGTMSKHLPSQERPQSLGVYHRRLYLVQPPQHPLAHAAPLQASRKALYQVSHVCSAGPVSLALSKQSRGAAGTCAAAAESRGDRPPPQPCPCQVIRGVSQPRCAEDCPSLLDLTLLALLGGTGLSLSALCC